MSLPLPRAEAIGVYIVEDDDLLREDFARAVASSPGLQLLGSTGSARQTLHDLQHGLAPDVLLVDLGLPDGDGLQLIQALRHWQPQARALVISVFDDDQRVLAALAAGAQGYLLKDADDATLQRAVHDVARGDAPLSPQVARCVLRQLQQPPQVAPLPAPRPAGPPSAPATPVLSPREVEILTLVSQGHAAREVARLTGLSIHTVNTHLRNCHSKLDARNRQQALNRARDLGQLG